MTAPPAEEAPALPTRPRRPPLDAATAEPRADDAPLGQPIVDPDAADPAPTGVRPAVRDGDGEPQLEPEPVTDGVPDEQDDYRNPDGADPVQWDSRLPQDSEPFERPPAGHDVQAFAVELEPLADRRTTALFRFEPWQPRGIRVGTFTLFPTVDLGAAWLSNVFRSKPARSDAALDKQELRPKRHISRRRFGRAGRATTCVWRSAAARAKYFRVRSLILYPHFYPFLLPAP